MELNGPAENEIAIVKNVKVIMSEKLLNLITVSRLLLNKPN